MYGKNMEKYPQYTNSQIQERKGISRFASAIIDLGLIWRETPNSDVGIDGQIELRDTHGQATGTLAAVQIKSGSSYIVGDEDTIRYNPSDQHANYWREFPVPVLLVIHDPESRDLYWTDARQQLRILQVNGPISIPKSRTISVAKPADLFGSHRPITEILEIREVVRSMAENRHNNPGFRLSFFELFGFGLADIGRKLFFSMSLCMEIVELRAAELGVPWNVGASEHDFVDRYIKFLVAQGLVYYDYSDYLIDRDVRNLAPIFLAPLTKRGDQVLAFMQTISNDAFHECWLCLTDSSVRSITERLDRVQICQDEFLERVKSEG
jgi:hypothetical protein